MVIVFSNCNNESILEDAKDSSKIEPTTSEEGWGIVATWIPEEVGCGGIPTSCYAELVYNESEQGAELVAFETAVAGDENDVKTYFTTGNWSTLFPFDLSSPELADLQSGTHDIIKVSGAGTDYYLCGATNTLSTTNVDFVLQIQQ